MWLKSIFNKPATSKQDEEAREVVRNSVSPQPPPKRAVPLMERAELLQPAKSVNNQIQYDEKLIPQLKGDHAALLLMYSSVANKMSAGTWDAVPTSLREMRMAMYGHLLTEGVKLYSYMRRSLAEEQNLLEVYRSYKKEMDGIGRIAFDFFDKYQGKDWLASPDARSSFKAEFDNLGKVLVDRITREENILYPLYMPS
ncbi:Hemerythrin HHE cation binding domain-containing protein [Collimonas sp. OK607]|uniref:hemerythrin domain-containing protein n=1 Tax=Collimonas sp. OK607 TaxID=1798194 RepID=UPI0008E6ADE0|nr:hemerythrin domain-containing protein [Collimonas sp. OK607]SFB24922.1 Hemerythrin HHE cation binding domain-containing protein [Collimonas sp. OK607]